MLIKNFIKSVDAIDNGNLSYFESEFNSEWADLVDSEGGWSLLHYASSRKQPEILYCLLEQHKSNPNITDNINQVALHSAALSNDLNSLKLLLNYGALPIKYDLQNRSPLNIATRHGSIECAKYMLPYFTALKSEFNNYYFQRLLIDAITYNQLELLNIYINAGLNVNLKDNDGYSLTHLAILESNPKILSHLISLGIKIEPLPKHDGRDLQEIAQTKKIKKLLRQAL